jgi:hypothetical protein
MKQQKKRGISIAFPIFIVLLIVKLTTDPEMSWWLVLAPFWVPLAALFTLFAIILIVALVIQIIYGNGYL